MLVGRLEIDATRVPHADRFGLIWLDRGSLSVEDGCLRFMTAGSDSIPAGDYRIPQQSLSMILLGPGSSVTHDALRILARQGTALCAIGDGGVRFYTAPPLLPDASANARRQVELWADPGKRVATARRMYGLRMGEVLPHRDIEVLRGIEGARVKEAYKLVAARYGIPWNGRRYDRDNPLSADLPNQAINHAASAVEGAAAIAVAATGTIPQLGFIHEDSGQSFMLDVADLFREEVTLPCAFKSVKQSENDRRSLEQIVRKEVAATLRRDGVIAKMIERIKTILDLDFV